MEGNPIWHLDWLTFNPDQPDPFGVTWIVTDQVGFWDGPTPRNDSSLIVEKINKHGAMMGPNYMQERVITLKGVTFAPDQGTLSMAVTQLSSICSDPSKTYQLSCDSLLGQIYSNVRLDGQVHISPYALNPSFQWSIQLVAPDPRKYTKQTFTSTIGLPQTNTGDGLDFNYAQNQVTNPQFTTDTSSWTAETSTTLARVTTLPGTFPVSGVTTGATATSTAAATNGMKTALTAINTQNNYVTASAYMYATTAKTVTVYVGWYDASNNLISETTTAQALTASTWTRASASGAAPALATQYRIGARESATAASSVFYATAFQSEYGALTPYTTTLSGLNYGNSSLANVGLTFGVSNTTGFSSLQNTGTAPAMPVYTLYGPLTTPVLTATQADGTTATLQYNATLGIGDTVVIDPKAPSVMFNGASRRYLLNPANFSGFNIPPIDGATGKPGSLKVGLSHSGSSTAGGYCTATYQWALF